MQDSQTLIVSETGTAELKIINHALTGANAADFSVTPETLTIQCTPGASGNRTAMLKVIHNAAGRPATYTLNCMGKLPGDVNGNGRVELADAVLALKITAGIAIPPKQKVNLTEDVNGDGKIGTPELIYILAHIL